MKKAEHKIILFIVLLCVSLLQTACGKGQGGERVREAEASPENNAMDLEILNRMDENGIDNTLDAYEAIARGSLEIEFNDRANGETGQGISGTVLGGTRGSYFAKHLYDPAQNCWDQLRFVADQGKTGDVRLDFGYDDYNQVMHVGAIWDSDHYLMYRIEPVDRDSENLRHVFFETDEELQPIKLFSVDFLSGEPERLEFVTSLVQDKEKRIHILTQVLGQEGWHYYILDEEGGMLFDGEDAYQRSQNFRFTSDGEVILQTYVVDEVNGESRVTGYRLWKVDIPTGEEVELAVIEYVFGNEMDVITMGAERQLFYAASDGIFRRDLDSGREECLYSWANHGCSVMYVDDMRVSEDGRIQVIFSESNERKEYLSLKPVAEKRKVQQITFAVDPDRKTTYFSAVAAFNKDYPSYHIDLKDDYDRTALLTQLIAGDGPVLVDTTLTGFEEHEKLWMPLDGLFQKLELEDELEDRAMELGEIDGRLYGVVSNFYISTIVAGQGMPERWDYDDFMGYIRQNDSLEAVYNNLHENGTTLILRFFMYDKYENVLLDLEDKTAFFHTDDFHEMLKAGEKYCSVDHGEPGNLYPEGTVLCNTIIINKPEDLEAYRAFYGEDIRFIGYPCKEGAGHYIKALTPIAIRETASVEEKAAAVTFMKYLLSYDFQLEASKTLNFGLSVRKDVLEKQFDSIWKGKAVYAAGIDTMPIENPDIQKDKEQLYGLLEEARIHREVPVQLQEILAEELERYFSGEITEEMLVDHLENRVGLYLKEGNIAYD